MTILVACGLVREAGILAQDGIVAIAGGGDAARLERELDDHCSAARGVRLIVSSGLAGALDLSLKPGDVVLATTALPGNGRGNAIVDVLREALPDARIGAIVGADIPAASVADKRRLHLATGALAVDMESHVAARVAARHRLPFVAIRVISDDARTALPPAALVGMKPDGGMALGAVLASLARAPGQLPALIRTGIEAERGFRALRRVHHALAGVGIALTDLGEFRLDM